MTENVKGKKKEESVDLECVCTHSFTVLFIKKKKKEMSYEFHDALFRKG